MKRAFASPRQRCCGPKIARSGYTDYVECGELCRNSKSSKNMGKNGQNCCRQQLRNTSKIFPRRNCVVSNTLPCSHACQHEKSVCDPDRYPAHFSVALARGC